MDRPQPQLVGANIGRPSFYGQLCKLIASNTEPIRGRKAFAHAESESGPSSPVYSAR